MCLPRQERAPGEGHFQNVGTLLRIESCKFSPDGRCAPRLPPPSGMARAPLRAAERAPLTPLNPKPLEPLEPLELFLPASRGTPEPKRPYPSRGGPAAFWT